MIKNCAKLKYCKITIILREDLGKFLVSSRQKFSTILPRNTLKSYIKFIQDLAIINLSLKFIGILQRILPRNTVRSYKDFVQRSCKISTRIVR